MCAVFERRLRFHLLGNPEKFKLIMLMSITSCEFKKLCAKSTKSFQTKKKHIKIILFIQRAHATTVFFSEAL